MYIGLVGLYLSEAQRQSDNGERGYPPDGVQLCDRTWTVVLTGHTQNRSARLFLTQAARRSVSLLVL